MQRAGLLVCIFISHVLCDLNPNWEHPHAWGKHQKVHNIVDDTHVESSGDSATEKNKNYCGDRIKYDVLEIYYLKLVYFLVSKDRLKLDPISGNLMRLITIEMSQDDIEQLAKIKNNIHAIDAKIFEILTKNRNGIIANSVENLFSFYQSFEMFVIDKIPFDDLLFFVTIFAFLLAIWTLSRVFKRNVIITFLIVIFLISYIFDYIRCCKEKEINMLLELQNANENPCAIRKPGKYDWFLQIFQKAPQDLCKQHLMGRQKYFNKEYCDIWEHFIDFIVYKNFQNFIQKMQHFVKTIISENSFPYNIIFAAVFLFFLKDLLISVVKSSMTNIFHLIFWRNRNTQQHETLPNNSNVNLNRPNLPINVILNVNSKKKKSKLKPKVDCIKATEENVRIQEITIDEVTSSSGDSDDNIKEEIKVII